MVLLSLLVGLLPAVLALDETDYTPIVVPLAVRGPYLGAYLTGRQDKNLATMDPHFWTTQPLGWKGLVRIDGETWNWMGNLTDWPACTNASIHHTAAATTFSLHPEPATVELTATFLSPITPADLFRQSLPFSYLHLSVSSLDGQPHQVEVYSEINGLWLADEEDEETTWVHEKGEKGDWVGVRARLDNQRKFAEAYKQDPWSKEWASTDRILQGDVYYAAQTPSSSSGVQTTFSAGHDAMQTRREFASSGTLSSTSNSTSPRPIRTRSSTNSSLVLDEPVFALSHSFGRISPSSSPSSREVLLSIGHVRDPLVRYMISDSDETTTGPDGKERPGEKVIELRPLWASTFTSVGKMLSFFFSDYQYVKEQSEAFNAKLYSDARVVDPEGGDEYAHVVAVSTRQIFMAMEAVWDQNQMSGNEKEVQVAWSPVTGEPVPAMVMLKEISSNGNVNTVDVIAPFLPFLLYASPSLLPLLLEPIYRYMETGLYVPKPPIHDLGDHYPNATGHNDYLYPGLPIEEAGNALMMALAGMRVAQPATSSPTTRTKVVEWWDDQRTRFSGAVGAGQRKIGWESKIGHGRDHRREGARMALGQARERYELMKGWAKYLEEECLYPGDQLFGSSPNQTSLVIKGILGMRAFSEIADDLGETRDRDHFRDVTERYLETFLDLAVAKDGSHLLGSYNNATGWITHYNLYFDVLLGLEVFPQTIYEMQDSFYPTVAEPYGPPLDSRFPTRAKTDWLAWASATCLSSKCRRVFLDGLARYFRASKNAVFGDSITPQEGWSVGFLSRPVAGGHYALLGKEVMAQERRRREQKLLEGEAEGWWFLAVGLGFIIVLVVSWRALSRWKRARSGYIELGGRRAHGTGDGRRGSEFDGGRQVWGAEDSPGMSLFKLELPEEESSEGEEDYAGAHRRRSRIA
ncbi:hypothetical protein JCM11251_005569 [Rhodosporidiobolus azoricus]